MITYIRAILKKVVGLSDSYRSAIAEGRPDELIATKMTQHYGFRSYPPEGTELHCLQFGNNNFSLAENDGSKAFNLSEGDVIIYRSEGIAAPTEYILITKVGTKTIIDIKSAGDMVIQGKVTAIVGTDAVGIQSNTGVQIGDNAGPYYYLVNQNFISQLFNAHVHTGGTLGGGLTGTPVAITPVLPVTTSKTSAD